MLFKSQDLHTWSERFSLPPVIAGAPSGLLMVDYVIKRVDDVRNLQVQRAYRISCKQRIIVPMSVDGVINPKAPAPARSYTYPIAIKHTMSLTNVDKNASSCYLIDYTPKTINSSVQANASTSQGSSSQSSSQYTTGSSTSETNSYEVSVNAGFSGFTPSGGVTASTGHSETQTSERSRTSGTQSGADSQTSSSDSMTIKDWASFASVDPDSTSPEISWLWGQEYPWDIFKYHTPPSTAPQWVEVPPEILLRMYRPADEKYEAMLFPPSNLALFGVNFVANASWLYTITGDQVNPRDLVQFTHKLSVSTGTHALNELPYDVDCDCVCF